MNVITKSGGNFFSGSFREGLSNPSWVTQTPLERAANIKHPDMLGKTHEGTFGGPVLRDRLWFFGAGRLEKSSTSNTFAQNGAGYTFTSTNRRGEVKFTGTLAPTQMVQVSFIENATEEANRSALGAAALLDASTLVTRQLPNRLFGANYSGTLKQRYFATVQYSQKQQSFRNNGGTSTALVDSPFRTMGALAGVPGGLTYNAPYLDATDPEQRNNRQVTGSVATLAVDGSLRQPRAEDRRGVLREHGHRRQLAVGDRLRVRHRLPDGERQRRARRAGTPVPVFTPGVSQIWNFQAVRGAEVDITTTSLYLQDRWTVSPRLTLDLGTRFEAVRSDATGDITTVDSTSIVPRLGGELRPAGQRADDPLRHLRALLGQVQPGAVRGQHQRRSSERSGLRLLGPAGSGSDFAPGFDLANYTHGGRSRTSRRRTCGWPMASSRR